MELAHRLLLVDLVRQLCRIEESVLDKAGSRHPTNHCNWLGIEVIRLSALDEVLEQVLKQRTLSWTGWVTT